MIKKYFIFILFLFSAFELLSQKKVFIDFYNYPVLINKINIRGYNTTTSTVITLLQTKDGFIWLGTIQGLYRFDGINLKSFDKSNIKSLPSNNIRTLFEDKKGNLWIGTDNGLLLKQKNNYPEYKIFNELNNKKITVICEDSKEIILVGTSDGLFQIKNSKVEPIQKFSSDNIITILRDSSKKIWVSSFEKGLFKYTGNLFERINFTKEEKITALYCDSRGEIFAGSFNGSIYSINDNKITYINKLPNNYTVSHIIKVNNKIWISSLGGGLFSIEGNIVKNYGREFGIFNNMISGLINDHENNIWFSTIGSGTYIINTKKIQTLTTDNGITDNLIHTIYEDSKNNIWIGTAYKGIDKITPNGELFHFEKENGLSDNSINSICEDSQGRIWIGTQNNGISIINKDKIDYYNNPFLTDKTIKSIFKDTKDNLWIGTIKGLYKIYNDSTIHFDISSGLPSQIINYISEDKRGNIIIGTTKGISIYNGENFINYNKTNGLIDDNINTIYCYNEGTIWIGTDNGLSQFKIGNIVNFSKENTLYDDHILSITESDNILWIGSKKGIFYIRKNEFLVNDENDLFLFSVGYNSEDGMSSNECYGISQPSVFKTSKGVILFPTYNGISIVNPFHIFSTRSTIPPNVIISEFKVDNIPVEINKSIILKPGKKSFEFTISILSFTNSEKNKFRYFLDGYDEEWRNGTGNTTIQYNNLPPGDYTLKVLASNSDGVWNLNGDSISFTLKPYFYQTKIFIIFSIAFVIILIITIENARVRLIAKRKKELEELVELRTKELKEINKTKDKLFSIISHDLRGSIGNFMSMLKLLVDEPNVVNEDELKDILKTMKDSSESTYYLLDNLLNWARSQRGVIEYNFNNQQINYIIDDIIFLFTQIAKSKGINLYSKVNKPVYAYFDKNTIHTAIRNLISNAIKFTDKGGNVWVDIEENENDNKITISINDNGVGIPPEKADQIFTAFQGSTTLGTAGEKGTGLGLLLCKEFVEKNGGRIWVESTIGKGSSFKFTLPKKI